MGVKRIQVRDADGRVCTIKCWVTEAVGGYTVGYEIYSKQERFQAFSDASCEQIAWYDIKSEILGRGYKILDDFHEY